MRWYQSIVASVVIIYLWNCLLHPATFHFIDVVNLIFHEAGHALTFFLPITINLIAGSFFQVLIPAVFTYYFWEKGDYVSMSVLLLWVAESLSSVSIYMSDAIPMQLPLLGGDSVIHDWNDIFNTINSLAYAPLIANCVYLLAILIAIMSTALFIAIVTNKKLTK